MRIIFNILFSTERSLNSINAFFNQLDTKVNLIPEGDGELVLWPIHLLPTERKSGQTIFALIPLNERRSFIAIRKDCVNSSNRIGFPDATVLNVSPEFVFKNLLEIKSDLMVNEMENEKILTGLHNSTLETAIIEGCFVNEKIEENYKLVPLDEREFGHFPGQGYLAVVGNSESSFGKMVRKLNKREDIVISNIERKLKKMSSIRLNAHCEVDQNGFFHLWVHSENGSIHISQSTRNQIEERAIDKLKLLS